MKKKRLLFVVLLAALGMSVVVCLWPRGEYVRGKAEFSREEIMRIFSENEEKFDYIVAVIKNYDIRLERVRIKRWTREIYLDSINFAGVDEIGLYTEYMPADEQFEAYLIDLLVREKLGRISVWYYGDIVFGPNDPIAYSENERRVDDGPAPIWGKLKENWYYYIHIPI
jgi:hypothetical protein